MECELYYFKQSSLFYPLHIYKYWKYFFWKSTDMRHWMQNGQIKNVGTSNYLHSGQPKLRTMQSLENPLMVEPGVWEFLKKWPLIRQMASSFAESIAGSCCEAQVQVVRNIVYSRDFFLYDFFSGYVHKVSLLFLSMT